MALLPLRQLASTEASKPRGDTAERAAPEVGDQAAELGDVGSGAVLLEKEAAARVLTKLQLHDTVFPQTSCGQRRGWAQATLVRLGGQRGAWVSIECSTAAWWWWAVRTSG